MSPAEFRLLAIGLVGFSAAVLVFVLGAGDRGGVVLPESTALAPPGARMIAAALDVSLAWLVASAAFDLGPQDWLAIVVGDVRIDFAQLVWTAAVGLVMSTVLEWTTGRTPGKWLAGCEVVSVRGGGERPQLWQALVRNIVKYPLAPVGLLGLGSPTLRHRGDTLAGTAVVIRPEAPPAADSD